jgi:hypothetical protein
VAAGAQGRRQLQRISRRHFGYRHAYPRAHKRPDAVVGKNLV